MKIKLSELWKHTGITIYITEEISTEDVPPGYYNFINKDPDDSLILLNSINELLYLDEYDGDIEIQVSDISALKKAENCLEGQAVRVLSLISDGWIESETGNDFFNLKAENNKLKEYINLYKSLKVLEEI